MTKFSQFRVLISGILSPLAALILYALVYSFLTQASTNREKDWLFRLSVSSLAMTLPHEEIGKQGKGAAQFAWPEIQRMFDPVQHLEIIPASGQHPRPAYPSSQFSCAESAGGKI